MMELREQVKAAIAERIASAMPITETSGWTREQVARAVAENIVNHPVLADALKLAAGKG